MRRYIASGILAAVLLAVPFTSTARQTCDFSDIYDPFLSLPFSVTNVESTGEYNTLRHIYHIAEPYDKVVKKLTEMFEKKQLLGDRIIMGITQQSTSEMYQLVIGFQNEHHYAQVTPEGSGTMISVEAAPVSYISGVYEIAIYGFTMPDGTIISSTLATDD